MTNRPGLVPLSRWSLCVWGDGCRGPEDDFFPVDTELTVCGFCSVTVFSAWSSLIGVKFGTRHRQYPVTGRLKFCGNISKDGEIVAFFSRVPYGGICVALC